MLFQESGSTNYGPVLFGKITEKLILVVLYSSAIKLCSEGVTRMLLVF